MPDPTDRPLDLERLDELHVTYRHDRRVYIVGGSAHRIALEIADAYPALRSRLRELVRATDELAGLWKQVCIAATPAKNDVLGELVVVPRADWDKIGKALAQRSARAEEADRG